MIYPARSKWRGRLIRYAPLLIWIGVIFYLSSDHASMSETSSFIRPLLHFLFPTAPEETLRIYHGYIRKGAHFAEYAVLAFFGVRAFSRSASVGIRKYRYILSIVLVAAVACSDELNQSFEVSRTGSPYDVLLDISGGAAMILFLSISKWQKPAQQKPARK